MAPLCFLRLVMKFGYSVAVRHQDNKTNVYQIELERTMDAEDLTQFITQVKVELPTAKTVLCSANPQPT